MPQNTLTAPLFTLHQLILLYLLQNTPSLLATTQCDQNVLLSLKSGILKIVIVIIRLIY